MTGNMGCIRCGGKIPVDGDAVCSECHEKYSLCLHCGVYQMYGKYALCRDCQLRKVGKCKACDEPVDDDSSNNYCVKHLR